MPRVGESATVIIDKVRAGSDTETSARTVWEYFHEKAKNAPNKYKVEPFFVHSHPGIRVELPMSVVVKDLWPELSGRDDASKEALKTITTNISAYLRTRLNAKLVSKGNYYRGKAVTPTQWWISNIWHADRQDVPTTSQKTFVKVSRKEAGEDREASPVTIRYACRYGCGYSARRNWNREQHEKRWCKNRPVSTTGEKLQIQTLLDEHPDMVNSDPIQTALDTLAALVKRNGELEQEVKELREYRAKIREIS
jgi:hypothetical protein